MAELFSKEFENMLKNSNEFLKTWEDGFAKALQEFISNMATTSELPLGDKVNKNNDIPREDSMDKFGGGSPNAVPRHEGWKVDRPFEKDETKSHAPKADVPPMPKVEPVKDSTPDPKKTMNKKTIMISYDPDDDRSAKIVLPAKIGHDTASTITWQLAVALGKCLGDVMGLDSEAITDAIIRGALRSVTESTLRELMGM